MSMVIFFAGLELEQKSSFLNGHKDESGNFYSKSLDVSGMDNLFLKRVLFEWLRDR